MRRGADYITSTGLKVDQGDVDHPTGRAGVALGKKFNYGSINDLDKPPPPNRLDRRREA